MKKQDKYSLIGAELGKSICDLRKVQDELSLALIDYIDAAVKAHEQEALKPKKIKSKEENWKEWKTEYSRTLKDCGVKDPDFIPTIMKLKKDV